MFKLIPTLQDSSICLRCQYRLRIQQGPRSSRRRPTTHSQPPSRRFTIGLSLRQEQTSSDDATTDNSSIERARYRYHTEALPSNRIYRRGIELSTKDNLGLNVLGEPAEVLILRDKQKESDFDSLVRVRASGPDRNPAQVPISSSGMLEEMAAEKGIIDIDEVCKNIESVRESWVARTRGGVTGVAYNDLLFRLQVGFTKQQLGAYLDRAERDPAADVFDLNVEISNSLYARSSWQLVNTLPRKSKAPKIVYDTPEGETNEKEMSAKERGQGLSKDTLVMRILRQCWHITPKFLESSLGEVEVRLQQLHLNLILNHKRDILKSISRSYDSKVEAWPQERIIRITSDYENCVDIVKLLIHTLENIQFSMIDLHVDSKSLEGSKSSPRELNNTMLRQIEKYTNTLVRPQGLSRKTLRVFYIGPDDADLLETRRLIQQILRPASAQSPGLAWSKGERPSSLSPAPVAVGSRLSLLDRNQEWSRWCSPQQENQKEKDEGHPSSVSGPAISATHGKAAFDAVKSFFKAPDEASHKLCNRNTPYWRPEIEYHDSVKLGQVMFPAKSAALVKEKGHLSKAITIKEIGTRSLTQTRGFLPIVPDLVCSFEDLESLENSGEVLQIRLSPSSGNVGLPVPFENLPTLEITISFDHENQTTSIEKVRLVNEKEKDFLQPQNVVDLRFARKRCVCANEGSIDPRIASFVQDSNFDIWGRERLKTPLGLSLSVPALAIQAHKGVALHEPLLIEYTSLGLELRSSLTISYQEPDTWPTLTYTNVEAGRIGGRRDELTLHNLRFARTAVPSTSPGPPAENINSERLSDDDHTSILFRKTAALIEKIERAGRGDGMPGLRMPVSNVVRNVIVKKTVRKLEDSFRKIDPPRRTGPARISGVGADWSGWPFSVSESKRLVCEGVGKK